MKFNAMRIELNKEGLQEGLKVVMISFQKESNKDAVIDTCGFIPEIHQKASSSSLFKKVSISLIDSL